MLRTSAIVVGVLGVFVVGLGASPAWAQGCSVPAGLWGGGVGTASLGVGTSAGEVVSITLDVGGLCTGPGEMIYEAFDPPLAIEPDCTFAYSLCGPPTFGYSLDIEFLGDNTATCNLAPMHSDYPPTFPMTCTPCNATQSFVLTLHSVPTEESSWSVLKFMY